MWATPMDTVDDEGHKLLETCFGNPIGGKGTFGATNHLNTRIVAQSTLDYWNNKVVVSFEDIDEIRRSRHAFINPAITIILHMGAGGHGVPPLGSPDG
ncbi:hypothetical protein SO802_007483 [Lithocarpus litseifolius]|uniref:Uncharacterized protein n=1 Tax=Lithocarpus litseifolius TaxID=425828 RepID=A0AAW2DNR8_9ROSI